MEDKLIEAVIEILKDTERDDYWHGQVMAALDGQDIDIHELITNKILVEFK